MKINSFQYSDKEEKWETNTIIFNSLTLLVGASGVGKTRILKAIGNIKKITQGKSLNGVAWCIDFNIDEDNYVWSGEFEFNKSKSIFVTSDDDDKDNNINRPTVLKEQLKQNGEIIVDREKSQLTFRGTLSPIPIKAEQSVIALIPDETIKNIEKEFKKIIYSDYSNSAQGIESSLFRAIVDEHILKKYKSTAEIKKSSEDLMAKLYWVYKKDKKLFKTIKETFCSVFQQVIDLRLEPIDAFKDTDLPLFLKASPFVQFKEELVEEWLPVIVMSAGMYRTLIHIVELFLSTDRTVILIDEFENSLGVNCIDEVTTEIKGAIDRMQFIITSHHPYIINNISHNNWKIVTRDGAKVSVQDANELNLGKSKHEAFIQLLNLPAYKTGKK